MCFIQTVELGEKKTLSDDSAFFGLRFNGICSLMRRALE